MIRSLTRLLVLGVALAACAGPEDISSPGLESIEVQEARAVAAAPYNVSEIPPLAGDQESIAWAVNDAGTVAVQSTYLPPNGGLRTARWFVKTGSIVTHLSSGGIWALGGGATTHVAAFGNELSRMTYSTSTGFSAPISLGAGGAKAVNEAGDIIGAVVDATIWKVDGTVITIPNPDVSRFNRVEGRDLNNSGDAAVSYYGLSGGPDRGFLRTADGVYVEFLPLAGHRSTYVRGVSERISGKIYVAGMSDDDNGGFKAVRWTVDVATNAVTAEVAAASTYTVAMSNDGTAFGVNNAGSRSAFVWKRGAATAELKTPKGMSNGRIWGVSGDGRYLAGDAILRTARRAILWTAQ